jgi:hypothetical protein
VPFESWAFDLGTEDQKKIERQPPLYRITIIGTKGRKTVLTLWPIPGEKGNDSNRVYGKTDDKSDLFIMRYFDIDPLIKKREYFFRE